MTEIVCTRHNGCWGQLHCASYGCCMYDFSEVFHAKVGEAPEPKCESSQVIISVDPAHGADRSAEVVARLNEDGSLTIVSANTWDETLDGQPMQSISHPIGPTVRHRLNPQSIETVEIEVPEAYSLIERAARAIALKAYTERTEYAGFGPNIGKAIDDNWRQFAWAALAVLEAIREPTDKMIASAWYDLDTGTGVLVDTQNVIRAAEPNLPGEIWTAMIDAELAAPEEGEE